MSPQMYLVECVVERLRKTAPRKEVTVYRWVVIANSDQEAIDSLRSETAHKTKGEWSATMIGQSMALPTQRSPNIRPVAVLRVL